MFGKTGSPAHRAARLAEKQSLLDLVMQETSKLRRTLGAPDRAIVGEYLRNVREVEVQRDRPPVAGHPSSGARLPVVVSPRLLAASTPLRSSMRNRSARR